MLDPMTTPIPTLDHEYKNHHLDSTRWNAFVPRDDDIIVSTSYKSGTTWMQHIIHQLIFKGDEGALPPGFCSPWLDARFQGSLEEVTAGLEAQTHRRFVKSHLPFDGLPYYPNVKYVVVARDARDVFMSLWNHYGNYTDEIMEQFNDRSEWSGPPFPSRPAEDRIRESWRDWMTRGWFEWESEGWPYWGNLHHTATYWPHRDLENVELFHYSDMLRDLSGQVQRLADYLGIEIDAAERERVVKATEFDQMKKDMLKGTNDMLKVAFKGGTDSFMFKGSNGRWREVFEAEDLELYDKARSQLLTPECARWLEKGWLG